MKQRYKTLVLTSALAGLLCVACAAEAAAQGRKGAGKAVARYALNATASRPAFSLELVEKSLLAQVHAMHGRVSDALISSCGLNPKVFGALSLTNERLMSVERVRYLKRVRFMEQNRQAVQEALRYGVTPLSVAYEKLIDPSATMIFLGEVHGNDVIQSEVVGLVNRYKKQYPRRRVYLATEFLADSAEDAPFEPGLLVRGPSGFKNRIVASDQTGGTLTLLSLLDVPILGLEPYEQMMKLATRPGQKLPKEADLEQLMNSFVGMRRRNLHWTQRLQELRAHDPEAVIFVYSGIDHAAYHNPYALPGLLPSEKPFVIHFNVPEGLFAANPASGYVAPPEHLLKQFNASEDAKLLIGWKKVKPEFLSVWGADLTVLVHPE